MEGQSNTAHSDLRNYECGCFAILPPRVSSYGNVLLDTSIVSCLPLVLCNSFRTLWDQTPRDTRGVIRVKARKSQGARHPLAHYRYLLNCRLHCGDNTLEQFHLEPANAYRYRRE